MILWVDKNVSNSYLEASQGTFHSAYTDSPSCHQVAARDFQCQKFVVKIQKLLIFGELWQPLVSKVTWIGSPMQVRSWDPGVLCCHAHLRCCPANTVRDSQLKLEKHQILVYGWGVLPPVIPINPYLGGNAQKNEPLFTCLFIYTHFESLSLELNRVPGSLLEPYMSQGGQGVAETPIVSKGLSNLIPSPLKLSTCTKRPIFIKMSPNDGYNNVHLIPLITLCNCRR